MTAADRPANPMLAAAGRALETVLNAVLARDARLRERLAPLEGRAIELTWSAPDIGLRLAWDGTRLRVGPRERDAEPDLALASTFAGIVGFLLPKAREAGLPAGKVRIAGDAELARRLSEIADGAGPDIEAGLTGVLGLELGTLVARGLRGAFAQVREAGANLVRDAADFARDDAAVVAASDQLADFARDVDTLRDDVERYAARLRRAIEDAGR